MASTTNIAKLSDIQKDVRMVLDQNQVEQGVLSGNRDTLELDALIEQKALHAARLILEVAPLRSLTPGGWMSNVVKRVESTDQSPQNPGMLEPQVIDRPVDFLRILSANVEGTTMSITESGDPLSGKSWERVLTDFMTNDAEEYLRAQSQFIGIRYNSKRPALFLNLQTQEFEFYGCEFGHATLRYIALPAYMTDGEITGKFLPWPDNLYEALLYQTASLVETAYKNMQAAQVYAGIARGYMGVNETEQQQPKTERK